MKKNHKTRHWAMEVNTEHAVVRGSTSEQRPERRSDIMGRALEAEGAAIAKVLRPGRSLGVCGPVRRLSGNKW